jgi:hypothetical protein
MTPETEARLQAVDAQRAALKAFECAAQAMHDANEAMLIATVCAAPNEQAARADLVTIASSASATWQGEARCLARNAQEQDLREQALQFLKWRLPGVLQMHRLMQEQAARAAQQANEAQG